MLIHLTEFRNSMQLLPEKMLKYYKKTEFTMMLLYSTNLIEIVKNSFSDFGGS